MLPCVRGVTFSGDIIDLGNPLGVVLERDSIPDVEGCPLRAASGVEVPVIAVASLNPGVSPPGGGGGGSYRTSPDSSVPVSAPSW